MPIDPKTIFAAIEKVEKMDREALLKQLSTSDKMLLRANGFSKEDVGWNGEDDRVFRNLIPAYSDLAPYLKKR